MDLVLGVVQVLVEGELGRGPLAVRLCGRADDVWDAEKEFLKKKKEDFNEWSCLCGD